MATLTERDLQAMATKASEIVTAISNAKNHAGDHTNASYIESQREKALTLAKQLEVDLRTARVSAP